MSGYMSIPPSETVLSIASDNMEQRNDAYQFEDLKNNGSVTVAEIIPELTPEVQSTEENTTQLASKNDHLFCPTTFSILTNPLNPTNPIFNTTTFAPSSKGPCFSSASQSTWYRHTSPLLATLLNAAKYPPTLTAQYLSFFHHSVIPAFGPSPEYSSTETWAPHLTYNHAPLEPSFNIQKDSQQIRYTFEPIGPLAGTPADPLNQSLPLSYISALASTDTCPSIDLTWWTYFTNKLFISDPEEVARIQKIMPETKRPPNCFLAFDLPIDDYAPMLKPYLMPQRRAVLEGKTTKQVVFNAIRELDSPATSVSLLPALKKLEDFFATRENCVMGKTAKQESMAFNPSSEILDGGTDGKEMTVAMLSIDCLSPLKSRIKFYAKTESTSLSNIREIYTMNNTSSSSSEVQNGLKELNILLKCLLGSEVEETWDMDMQTGISFLFFGFEILSGREECGMKVYIPMWATGLGNERVQKGLGRYFEMMGWKVGYEGIFEGLGNGTSHTFIYFAYTKEKGVYITLYYAPGLAEH